eukprot:112683-Prymnesium_polylepis.1
MRPPGRTRRCGRWRRWNGGTRSSPCARSRRGRAGPWGRPSMRTAGASGATGQLSSFENSSAIRTVIRPL